MNDYSPNALTMLTDFFYLRHHRTHRSAYRLCQTHVDNNRESLSRFNHLRALEQCENHAVAAGRENEAGR